MATKPELNIAEYGKDISSVQYNDNFDKLNDYIEAISEELTLKVNTINSQLSSNVLSNLQSIYPVGSLYIGTTDNCPIANLFGTWEKVAEGLVVDIDGNVPVVGNGMTLGLTNGSVKYGINSNGGSQMIIPSTGTYGKNIGTPGSGSYPSDILSLGVTTDPTKSGLVGTANATKLEVNIWKRTALYGFYD